MGDIEGGLCPLSGLIMVKNFVHVYNNLAVLTKLETRILSFLFLDAIFKRICYFKIVDRWETYRQFLKHIRKH